MTVSPSLGRNSVRFRWIALVFTALLAVGLAAAYVVYRRYVAYEPTAARHVPADSLAAARFDLTHVMLYQPFRASLFPVVDEVLGGKRAGSRRAELDARGLRVNSEVREVVLAFGPAASDWLLMIGGRLPAAGAAQSLAAVFRAEAQQVIETAGGGFLLPEHRVAFAQAADSTLVFGSSAERVRTALPALSPRDELSDGAGGLFIAAPWLPPPLQSFRVTLRAGSVVAVEGLAAFQPAGSGSAAELSVRALLAQVAKLDPALESAVQAISVQVEDSALRFQLGLPAASVERLAALAADSLTGSNAP